MILIINVVVFFYFLFRVSRNIPRQMALRRNEGEVSRWASNWRQRNCKALVRLALSTLNISYLYFLGHWYFRCSLFAICKQRTKWYIYPMKSHNGMRPQDVVILLKILTTSGLGWQYRDLSADLFLSVSEISESLHRSHIAGLVDESKRKVYRQSLMEFIRHGLHYVFPAVPGGMVTGIPTAHSYPFYSSKFQSELNYAWPDDDGDIRGLSIQPLYKSVVKAVKRDELLYKMLASIDIIRVGRTRELKVAIGVLEETIL